MSESKTAQTPTQADELGFLVAGARDALTDDMVSRLSGTFAETLQLLDRINHSRLDQALSSLTLLVESGDLERIVHLARALGAADDAVNDEMVGRMASVVGGSMDLLDRANRSGVVEALPIISDLVNSGDLERLTHLARLLGAAEDALNDEMVARLAAVISDGLSLIDRLMRNDALSQIVTFLLNPETQNAVTRFGEALVAASNEYQKTPPPRGGVASLWHLLKEPSNQQAMQFFGVFGKHLQAQQRRGHAATPD